MLTLGQKIKAIRKEQGLTQAELVGDRITRNQLSLIENGINNPSISTLEFLAQRLNVPMSYFLSNDDFSLHKCQKLVTKAETLVENQDYASAATEIEDFLKSINDQDNNTMKDLLGRLYALLGMCYARKKKPEAKETLLTALEYLKNSNQITYLSKVYNNLGVIHQDEDDLDQAESYYTTAYNIIPHVNLENIVLKLNIAFNISFVYLKQERYAELITFVNDSLEYSKKYKIFHNYGGFSMLISVAYKYTSNYKQAIQCTIKAVEYFQFSDDEENKNTCYSNLGIYYRLAGDYENSLKYLDIAKRYFELSGNFIKTVNAKAEFVKTMFLIDNKNESFLSLLNEVIRSIDDNNENKSDLLAIMGVCLLEENQIEAAFKLFQEADELNNKPVDSEFIAYAYIGLSKIYKHNQEWQKAYTYLDKANALPHKAIKNIYFE